MIERWIRDARDLGLPTIERGLAEQALDQLVTRAFEPSEEGILRLEARSNGPWIGVPRGIGEEPPHWAAVISSVTHPGPSPKAPGAKRGDLDFYHQAREELAARPENEALLVDAEGRIVEGTRSNLLVVDGRGQLLTPALDRGPVRGVARAILLGELPEISEGDIRRSELDSVGEVIAVNSVRGARAICSIDGQPVGDGEAGPWSVQLDALLREHR